MLPIDAGVRNERSLLTCKLWREIDMAEKGGVVVLSQHIRPRNSKPVEQHSTSAHCYQEEGRKKGVY